MLDLEKVDSVLEEEDSSITHLPFSFFANSLGSSTQEGRGGLGLLVVFEEGKAPGMVVGVV